MKNNLFKKSVSVFLAVLMVMSCWVFAPEVHEHLEAEAATTGSVNPSALTAIYSGSGERGDSSKIVICSDGEAGNTTVGHIRFNISSFPDFLLNSVLTVNSGNHGGTQVSNCRVDIYPLSVNQCQATSGTYLVNNIATVYGGYYNSATGVTNALNYYGLTTDNKLGTIYQNQTGSHTFDVSSVVNAAKAAGQTEVCFLFIMPEIFNDGNGNSWSDTHIIVSGTTLAYTAGTLTQISSIDELKSEIEYYEACVENDGEFYTNMNNNYRAYNDAKRYYDAVVYGGVEFNADLASRYYSALHEQVYSNTVANTSYVNYLNANITSRDGATVSQAYRKNVIWYPWDFSWDITSNNARPEIQDTYFYFTMPNTIVGITNDSETTFPLHSFFWTSTGSRYVRYVIAGSGTISSGVVGSSDFTTMEPWKISDNNNIHTTSGLNPGTDGFGGWVFEKNYRTDVSIKNEENNSGNFSYSQSQVYQISSYAQINKSTVGVNATTTYKKVDQGFTFGTANKENESDGTWYSKYSTDYGNHYASNYGGYGGSLYVVYMDTYKNNYENWKTLMPALSYSNYNGYVYDNAITVTDNLDKASDLNLALGLNESQRATNIDSTVQTWATNVNSGATALANAKAAGTTRITNKYVDLTAAIKAADSIYSAGNTKYTAASWNAFKTAYEAARAHMASLNPATSNTQYSTNATTVGNLATALTNAQNALQYVTVTYKYYDGTVAKTLSAANGEILIGTTAAELAAKAPANTVVSFADDETHYTYSWPAFANVTDSAVYQETRGTESHSFTNFVSDNNATCKEDGTKTATCDKCTATHTVTDVGSKDKVDHTPGAAATCTSPQTCTVCGEELTPVANHTPGAAATCTTAQTCTVCGEVLVEALGHNFSAAVRANDDYTHSFKCSDCDVYGTGTRAAGDATANGKEDCLAYYGNTYINVTGGEDGTHKQQCSVCQQYSAETPHTWNNGVVSKEPSCSEMGEKTYTCTANGCGATKTSPLDMTAHTWTEKSGVVKTAGTCTTEAVYYYGCADCDAIANDAVVNGTYTGEKDATNHTGTANVVKGATAKTCTTDGYTGDTHWSCCDAVANKGTTIPAGHEWSNWTQYNSGSTHRRTCSFCDAFEEGNHSYTQDPRPVTMPGSTGHYHNYKCELCEARGSMNGSIPQQNIGTACYQGAEATYTKKDGSVHTVDCVCGNTKEEGHWWNVTSEVEATCTTPGSKTSECDYCKAEKTETLPAGHKAGTAAEEDRIEATCTTNGSYNLVVRCTVCNVIISSEEKIISAAGHTFSDVTEANAATCIATGNEAYKTCTVCNKFFAADADVMSEDAKDSADDFTTKIDSTNHVNTTEHTQEDATCLTVGYTAGTYCDDCKTWISGHEEIPAIAHKNKVHHAEEPATCVATGTIEYWSCPDCDKNFSDEACTTEVTDLTIDIDPDNHTKLNKTDAVANTCETAGNIDYWTCEGCKKIYIDADAKTEITAEDTILAAKGHSYGEATYTWTKTDDVWSCTAERVCANDNAHKETATATITSEVTKEPTCTEMGTTTYTATFDKTWATTETNAVVDVAAKGHSYGNATCDKPATCTVCGATTGGVLGHDWAETTYDFAADGSACTATRVCNRANCDYSETATATITSEVTDPATCEGMGTTTYTATFAVDWAKTQTKDVKDVAAINHNWADATYSFANDGSSCTAQRVCKNDASHVENATATITSEITTPATCEEMGTTTYTATFDVDWAETQTKDVVDIPAKNHAWSVTYNFAEDGKSCTATRVCANDAKHNVTVEAEVTSTVKTPATCEGMGTTTYTATFDADWAETQTKDVVDIPAKNHAWSVTYNFAEDGKTCTATRVCANDAKHNVTVDATITSEVTDPATCEGMGTTTYTATFAETWAAAQTLDVQDIPAINHDWDVATYNFAADGKSCTAQRVCKNDASHVENATATITSEITTPATCIEMGTTTYTATFAETWAAEQTKDVKDVAIDNNNHVNLVQVGAKEETCTEIGWNAYEYCSECDYTTYVEIPAKNHDWNITTYSFAADGSSCTAQRVCKNDASHVENATATITSAVKTPATCEGMGTTTYTATFDADWAETQTKDVVDIPAKNHAWSVEYNFAEDGKTCTATRVCANDASHNVTATATITSEVTDPATCEGMGTTTYTATFDADWADTQTKDVVDIPAKNHAWSVEYNFAADGSLCTAQRVCKNDASHVENATATIASAVKTPATCTVDGWTTYTATFAETWAAAQTLDVQDIPAINHDWDKTKSEDNLTRPVLVDGVWTKGYYTYTCKNDPDHTTTEEVARAEYEAYENALSKLEALLETDITEEAKAVINEAINNNKVEDNLITTEQPIIDEATENLEKAFNNNVGSLKVYTVIFVVNGVTVNTQSIVSGDSATAPADPTKAYDAVYHYEFAGWDKAFTNVTADITVTAQFDAIEHTYTHTDKDDTYHTDKCTCGYSKDVEHTETSEVTTKASCFADGVRTYTCTVCGGTRTETIAKRAHNLVDTTVALEPTCSATGIMNQKCDCAETAEYEACTYTTTRVMDKVADAHKWETEYTVDKKASCDEAGSKSYHCEYCDTINTDSVVEIAKREHNLVDTTVALEPTCSATGIMNQKCDCAASDEYEACTYTTTRVMDKVADAHKWETEYTVDKKASCDEAGSKSYHCEYCDTINTDSVVEIAKREHNLVDTTVALEPTCSATGIMNQKCDCAASDEYEACTYTTTRVIPVDADNHAGGTRVEKEDVVAGTCISAETWNEVTYCSDCNAKLGTEAKTGEKDSNNHIGDTYTKDEDIVLGTCVSEKTWNEVTYCSDCNAKLSSVAKTGEKDANNHVNLVQVGAKEATCTEIGWNAYEYCDKCDYTTYVEIPVKAHDYKSVVTEPTCTEDGVITYTCACGDSYTEAIPAKGHDYEAVVTAPTCTDGGYTTYTCSCGDSYVADETPAAGHAWGEWIGEGDCTTTVVLTRTCSVCGKTETKEVSGNSHSAPLDDNGNPIYDNIKEADCTNGRFVYYKCTVCGAEVVEKGEALGHDIVTERVEPTCTRNGYIHEKCTRCGEYNVKTTLEKLGHSWIAKPDKAPTCDENGYENHVVCLTCGEEHYDVVSKTGHADNDGDGICDKCNHNIRSGDCGCFCHSNNWFIHIIYSIIRFIWKIFGVHRECVCGAMHY